MNKQEQLDYGNMFKQVIKTVIAKDSIDKLTYYEHGNWQRYHKLKYDIEVYRAKQLNWNSTENYMDYILATDEPIAKFTLTNSEAFELMYQWPFRYHFSKLRSIEENDLAEKLDNFNTRLEYNLMLAFKEGFNIIASNSRLELDKTDHAYVCTEYHGYPKYSEECLCAYKSVPFISSDKLWEDAHRIRGLARCFQFKVVNVRGRKLSGNEHNDLINAENTLRILTRYKEAYYPNEECTVINYNTRTIKKYAKLINTVLSNTEFSDCKLKHLETKVHKTVNDIFATIQYDLSTEYLCDSKRKCIILYITKYGIFIDVCANSKYSNHEYNSRDAILFVEELTTCELMALNKLKNFEFTAVLKDLESQLNTEYREMKWEVNC